MADKNSPSPKMSVPPGRSLADMPKLPPKDIPTGHAKPRNARITLREMITEDDKKLYLVDLLKTLGSTKKKGPWRDYLEFFIQNQSGDVDSMSAEVKAKCEKIKKDLNDTYFEEQGL